MQNVLITGANRGIGFALVQEYLEAGDFYVFASCRTPQTATELQELVEAHPDKASLVQLDISDMASIESSLDTLSTKTDVLDILINNGAVLPRTDETLKFGHLKMDALTEMMQINSVAPLIVTQTYAHLLEKSANPRVIMVSSEMGSMQWTKSGGTYGYRMSKAAMNMTARTLAMDENLANPIVITTHPGNVITKMSGLETGLMPRESASGLFKVINSLTADDNGKFYQWDGSEHIW